MSDTYDLQPKIPIHSYGAILRTKKPIECTPEMELDLPEDYSCDIDMTVDADEVLFYVEDKQFMASSRTFNKGMSAWIRFHFITSDKRDLWYTLVCSSKRLWDYATYRTKKRDIRVLFDDVFEVVELGEEDDA